MKEIVSAHVHEFVESPNSYALICSCGMEIGVESMPSILEEKV